MKLFHMKTWLNLIWVGAPFGKLAIYRFDIYIHLYFNIFLVIYIIIEIIYN